MTWNLDGNRISIWFKINMNILKQSILVLLFKNCDFCFRFSANSTSVDGKIANLEKRCIRVVLEWSKKCLKKTHEIQKCNKFSKIAWMQNNYLHLKKGICSAQSIGRHQNHRYRKTLLRIIDLIYSNFVGRIYILHTNSINKR